MPFWAWFLENFEQKIRKKRTCQLLIFESYKTNAEELTRIRHSASLFLPGGVLLFARLGGRNAVTFLKYVSSFNYRDYISDVAWDSCCGSLYYNSCHKKLVVRGELTIAAELLCHIANTLCTISVPLFIRYWKSV